MSRARGTIFGLFLASLTLVASVPAGASICGFPGGVMTGANGGGRGFVALYSLAPGFPLNGIARVTLGTPFGDSCMEQWIESTIDAGINFNAVWSPSPPDPAACGGAGCNAGPAVYCTAPTFCVTFP